MKKNTKSEATEKETTQAFDTDTFSDDGAAKKHKNHKKLKYGMLSTSFIAIFIALVVLLNVIASILTDRFSLKADLTAENFYDVSQESLDYVSSLTDEVEITVLSDEAVLSGAGVAYKMLVEMMYKYQAANSKIKISFVDVTANPTAISKYQEYYKGEFASDNVVVYSNERVRVFNFNDMFVLDEESEYYQYYQAGYYSLNQIIDEITTGYDTESTLTSAIMYVTNANPMKATIFGNQTEGTWGDGIVEMLDVNGYDYEYVDPDTGTISEDSALLIIPAPENDYTSSVIDKLDAYMYNNGQYERDVIYLASIFQSETPNIDSWLSLWGISVGRGLVYESDSSYYSAGQTASGSSVQYIIAQLAEETYSAGITNPSLPLYTLYLRPITHLFETQAGYTVTSLMKTSTGCCVIPEDYDPETFSLDDQTKQSFDVVSISTRSQIIDNERRASNVMVIGSAHTTMFSESAYNNSDFFVSAINTMTGKSSSIELNIVPKTISNYDFIITDGQSNALSTTVMFIIPLVLLACGIVVWVRRRHR